MDASKAVCKRVSSMTVQAGTSGIAIILTELNPFRVVPYTGILIMVPPACGRAFRRIKVDISVVTEDAGAVD
jgi:hypothetical protein